MLKYFFKSWESYKKNWLVFVGAELIQLVLISILIGISIYRFFSLISPYVDLTFIENTDDQELLKNYYKDLLSNRFFTSSLLEAVGSIVIFSLLSIFVLVFFNMGKVGIACESIKRKTSLASFFKFSFKYGFRWFLTSVILFFMAITFVFIMILASPNMWLNIILLLILIFMAGPILFLIPISIIVDNSSVVGCIGRAWQFSIRNYGRLFGLWASFIFSTLFFLFISSVLENIPFGFLFVLILTLFIIFVFSPLVLITFAAYYIKNRKKESKMHE